MKKNKKMKKKLRNGLKGKIYTIVREKNKIVVFQNFSIFWETLRNMCVT
jgi:hypothetical protein